jgi:hypothetical protein
MRYLLLDVTLTLVVLEANKQSLLGLAVLLMVLLSMRLVMQWVSLN